MRQGITKEHSKALQGLAILMMLYHHLFSYPEALGKSYFSVLSIFGPEVEIRLAWLFKMCVGIYAFVSGYGLCKGARKLNGGEIVEKRSFIKKLTDEYKFVLKKLFSFYKQYWLVFILFIPIGFIFFNKEFVFSEFLLNFIGIKSTYNGAWWYVLQYVKFLALFPIIDCLFTWFKNTKDKVIWGVAGGVIIISLIMIYILNGSLFAQIQEFIGYPYFLCFMVGYLIARFDIIEMSYSYISSVTLNFLGILGFVLVIAVRVRIAKDASSVGLDYIFVPILAFGFCILMNLIPKISKFFEFFGGLSTYMWLTHVFFYDHYAKNVVMFSGVSTGIYLTLLVLSLVTALILRWVYGKLSTIFGSK